MLKSYITTTLRHLSKSRLFASFNLIGLATGISSVLLIGLYVLHETSFDSFFTDSERIYRVPLKRIYPERQRLFASSSVMLAPTLKENRPEIEEATRFQRLFFQDRVTVEVGEEAFEEPRFRFADEHFFKVFSHQFLQGNPLTALQNPNSVVINKSIAEKYFGTTLALNKTLTVFDTVTLMVTGVIKDIPDNSHMHFDLLSSIYIQDGINSAIESNNWINPWLYTYIKLKEGITPEKLEAQLEAHVDQYGAGNIAQALGDNYKELGHRFQYFLQPIEDIHLTSKMDVEVEANSDELYVNMLTYIAFIILIISTINFINLSTARSSERAKEVGIRKVLGSLRSRLIQQFLSEAIITTTLSALLAVIFLHLTLPFFNELLNTSLSFEPLLAPEIALGFIGFIVLVGVIAGIYPALVISSIKSARVLKGSYKTSNKGIWLRNSLIVLQFFISVVMISGAVAVHQQMSFLKNKDLGFDKDNVMVIENMAALGDNIQVFKDNVNAMSQVVSSGGAFAMPGEFLGSGVFRSIENPDIADLRTNTITIDDYFFNTMKFELKQGRHFDENFNDSASVILNEAAVKAFGINEPIGSKIVNTSLVQSREDRIDYTIVGIVKDYNFTSLHSPITPLVLFNGSGEYQSPILAIRVEKEQLGSTIETINKSWHAYTDAPFSYSFLDQNLENQYQSDFATSRIFDLFTYIAIIMSCIGLFGLTTYVVQQRTKEMSIRKVLGAHPIHIVFNFSKDLARLILVAFVIGIPVSYILISMWLENFAYHVEVSIITFLLAGGLTLFFVVTTVSYQTLKLAFINPINAIRND